LLIGGAAFRWLFLHAQFTELLTIMYSSAANYVTNEGIVAIELMPVPKIDARKSDWTRGD
jgi:hypothetical protein